MGELLPAILIGLALLAGGTGLLLVRVSGAEVRLARRLAGARGYRVAELLAADPPPSRPVRVAGRVRCPDPILADGDERLVALHRDVEVRLPDGSWRTIERLRDTRGFELWDHAGALPVDPAAAAEPLVTIPHVWRGTVEELGDAAHRAAVERLAREVGPPTAARSVTRMLSVVDHLLVLAEVRLEAGGARLQAPPGGYVISALALEDAMRLLGGRRRGLLLVGALLVGVALLAAVAGVALALLG